MNKSEEREKDAGPRRPVEPSTISRRGFLKAAGAALYPQNPGMNPTGPLIALAYFAGGGIREIYLDNPGRIMT